MKIAVIGGGGVRAPQLVEVIARHAHRLHLDQLCLMDSDENRLRIMASLGQHLVREAGSPFELTSTSEAREALLGCSYMLMTVRAGGENARILDERIAMQCGVLGQETTGAGGFAMALRSIPVILDYARLAREICPQAWIINFTNPAGLVTQSLQNHGFERALGICDSANRARHEASQWLKIPVSRLHDQVFGLNHLSWTRSLNLDGEEVLPRLLEDDGFLTFSRLNLFDPALIRRIGMYLNEYLYYYYYPEKAQHELSQRKRTRGEEIAAWSQELMERLNSLELENHPGEGMRIYRNYRQTRSASYMDYRVDGAARGSQVIKGTRRHSLAPPETGLQSNPMVEEGYAGVAIEVISALEGGPPTWTALNIPNQGAIDAMHARDVVEVSCKVEKGAIQPLVIGEIPEHQELLMRSVKRYEGLALEAIGNRSRSAAVEALMAHPLIASYSVASRLVEEYLQAHVGYTGAWDE